MEESVQDLEHDLVILLLLGDERVEGGEDAGLGELRGDARVHRRLPDDDDHLEQHIVVGEARREVAREEVEQRVPTSQLRELTHLVQRQRADDAQQLYECLRRVDLLREGDEVGEEGKQVRAHARV